MSSELFRKTLTSFQELQNVDDYVEFYKNHDFWILCVPIVRMKNKEMWDRQWGIRYDMNMHLNKENFLCNLDNIWVIDRQWFLDFLTQVYQEILETWWLSLDPENDLSVIFSGEPLEDLLCFCRKIQIHAWKEVMEFTYETCFDTLFYYRATKENKLYEHIQYNKMMKDVCMSFLEYLEEENIT